MQTYVVRGQTSLRRYAEKIQDMLSRVGPSEMTMTGESFGATHFFFTVGIRPEHVGEACLFIRDVCRECTQNKHLIRVASSLFSHPLCKEIATSPFMIPI